jgi:predicted porin
VIESKDNWNYSRSLLFAWAIPYYHTGLRLTYPVASNFTAALHVVNNWNSTIDNNDFKSLGLMLNYALSGSTALILNVMDGVEESEPNIAGKKTVFDIILTHQLTDALALTLNADYGDERTLNGLATWKGVAAYGRYAIDSVSAIALRLEIFDDPMGYATGLSVPKLDIKEITGTYEYKFSNSLLLRGEARYDFANTTVFDKKTTVNSQNSQATILIGAVVMF